MKIPALSPENIDVPKSRSRELAFLSPVQVSDLLNSANGTKIKDLRDRALLETLFSTGLRVSELVKLDRDKINLERGEFSVIGKGGRARVVFLSKRATEWLGKYFEKGRTTINRYSLGLAVKSRSGYSGRRITFDSPLGPKIGGILPA